jgi:hypothetical protein
MFSKGPKGRPFVVTAKGRPFRPFGYGGHSSRADGPGYLNGWAFGPNRSNSSNKNASQRGLSGLGLDIPVAHATGKGYAGPPGLNHRTQEPVFPFCDIIPELTPLSPACYPVCGRSRRFANLDNTIVRNAENSG